MKILVVGASSYVGAYIYNCLRKNNNFIVKGTYFSNKLFEDIEFLDIRDCDKVNDLILRENPDIVIHVAAKADGYWCEDNFDEAVAVNEQGTQNIVEAVNKINSQLIFISSYAAQNNDFVYGKTKNKGEDIVKQVKKGYVIIRPSLILGVSLNVSNDRDFNNLLKSIKNRSCPAYDISWKFQPTWLKHLFEVIDELIYRMATNKQLINEIIPVAVPEVKSKYHVAYDILGNFGLYPEKQDFHDSGVSIHNLDKLAELNLPTYNYKEMIEGIVKEIKDYFSER